MIFTPLSWQPIADYKGGLVFLLYPDGCIGLGDQRDLEGEPPRMLPLYWMPCPELPFTPEEWRTMQARNEACGIMQPAEAKP